MVQSQSYKTKGGGIITTSSPRLQASLRAQGATRVSTPTAARVTTRGGGGIGTPTPSYAPRDQAPIHDPVGGVGSRETVGNTIYQFNSSGDWIPVGSTPSRAAVTPSVVDERPTTAVPSITKEPLTTRERRNILPTPAEILYTPASERDLEIGRAPEVVQPFLRAEAGLEQSYGKAIESAERYGEPVRTIRKAGQYVVGGSVLGPVGFPRFIRSAVTEPIETLEGAYQSFTKDPVRFTLEGVGGAKVLGRAGVRIPEIVTSKVPKITYGSVEVPIKGAGPITVYKGLYVKAGSRTQPLFGKTPKGFELGTPKPEKLGVGSGIQPDYVPVTPLETKVIAKKGVFKEVGFENPMLEAEKVDTFTDLMKMTEKQKSKFIDKELPLKIESLSKAGVKEALSFSKKSGLVDKFYGSFTAVPQLIKEFKRVPGDIDVFLKTASPEQAQVFANNLVSRLNKKGETTRISKQSPTLIESNIKGRWRHAVDIHYVGEPLPVGDALLTPKAIEGAYGFTFEQPPIKIGGQPVMTLSESGLRKGAASLIFQERGLGPKPYRIKDVPDFLAIQKTLIESAGKGIVGKLRYPKVRKGRQLVEKIPGLFPDIDFTKPGKVSLEVPLVRKPPPPASPNVASILFEGSGQQVPVSPKTLQRPPSPSPGRSPASPASRLIGYVSPSPSRPPSRSPRPSVSPSPSRPPSRSPSRYPSPSPLLSPPPSKPPSPYLRRPPSRLPSPSLSPSPSPLLSPPPSKPPSPYLRRPPSRLPSPSLSPFQPARKQRVIVEKMKKRPKIRPKYSPSLLAVIGGITARTAPRATTGIGIRPVITSSKSMRRLL